MRRFLIALLILAGTAASASAQTLTTREIVDLTKAGISEQALLALIEVHRSIFPVDRETLMMLKSQGVSDNVIVAMIRSGRDPLPVPEPPPPPPTPSVIVDRGDGTQPLIVSDRAPVETKVVVVERGERDAPSRSDARHVVEREVPVAVPVYVPVPVRRDRDRDFDDRDPPKKQEPVYWGFGGKLRPDAWKPSQSSKPTKETKKND